MGFKDIVGRLFGSPPDNSYAQAATHKEYGVEGSADYSTPRSRAVKFLGSAYKEESAKLAKAARELPQRYESPQTQKAVRRAVDAGLATVRKTKLVAVYPAHGRSRKPVGSGYDIAPEVAGSPSRVFNLVSVHPRYSTPMQRHGLVGNSGVHLRLYGNSINPKFGRVR